MLLVLDGAIRLIPRTGLTSVHTRDGTSPRLESMALHDAMASVVPGCCISTIFTCGAFSCHGPRSHGNHTPTHMMMGRPRNAEGLTGSVIYTALHA